MPRVLPRIKARVAPKSHPMIVTAAPIHIPKRKPAARLNGVPGKQKRIAMAYRIANVIVP